MEEFAENKQMQNETSNIREKEWKKERKKERRRKERKKERKKGKKEKRKENKKRNITKRKKESIGTKETKRKIRMK